LGSAQQLARGWPSLLHAAHAISDDLEALRPTADMVAWNAAIVRGQAAASNMPELVEDDYGREQFAQMVEHELRP
jgi:hypothetical protein